MKKLIYTICTLAVLGMMAAACSGDSYEKRLNKEKKAIKNFLGDNEIEVLREYPADHKFKENQFYQEGSTGVYFRVVDAGNYKDSLKTTDVGIQVNLRTDSVLHMVKKTKMAGNNTPNASAIQFNYGKPATYTSTNTSSVKYLFMSPALVLPLQKGVGNGAIVQMIVPFVNGSNYQVALYEPFYYEYIRYTYHKQVQE